MLAITSLRTSHQQQLHHWQQPAIPMENSSHQCSSLAMMQDCAKRDRRGHHSAYKGTTASLSCIHVELALEGATHSFQLFVAHSIQNAVEVLPLATTAILISKHRRNPVTHERKIQLWHQQHQ